jgi:membrane-associated HD superfamily phosphohydrolase
MKEILIQPFKLLIHPISATEKMKEKESYSLIFATVIVGLFFLAAVVEYQYTGKNFNFNKPESLNVFFIMIRTILIFILFTVANWSVSTLLEGKGNFSQIWAFTAYSLVPYIIISFFSTIITNLISQDEEVFLSWFVYAGIILSAVLIFVTLMTIHQFTFKRTIFLILLTAFSIAVMVFLLLLFFSLVQQIYSFANTIYNEIRFRLF